MYGRNALRPYDNAYSRNDSHPGRHRRSIRLRDYDYTQNGAYFVTICAHERLSLFGRIVDGEMRPNAWGEIVQAEWAQTAVVRPYVELDAFVVMPNHLHGIIVITDDDGAHNRAQHAAPLQNDDDTVGAQCIAPVSKRGVTANNVVAGSLGAIVRGFKAAVTRRINALPDAPEHAIWQRNYYEHIIRNEAALDQIRQYIANNPAKWAEDSLYAP